MLYEFRAQIHSLRSLSFGFSSVNCFLLMASQARKSGKGMLAFSPASSVLAAFSTRGVSFGSGFRFLSQLSSDILSTESEDIGKSREFQIDVQSKAVNSPYH